MKAVKQNKTKVKDKKPVVVIPPLSIYDMAMVLDRPVMTPKGRGVLDSVRSTKDGCWVKIGNHIKVFSVGDVTPILSNIEKMDEYDMKQSGKVYKMYHKENRNRTMVHVGLWLIRNGWDALGWIGSGLAIEEMES